ncbi:MFS transporter [Mailhella massiliensis]|uniref:MFS transporter n=1 Tax=Mailhella massiliensis TaxID=1903261 RepID=UPI0009F8AC74|nr:MFS transporter [Mailhella massiliensis]
MENISRPRRQVVIFALLTAVCVAADAMLYVVLPVRWMEAGLSSLWEVGLVLSLNRLARLPLNPVIGWVYSRLSIKTCAIFAALLALLIPIGYAHASTLAAWAALRILWGLAWSLLKLGGLFTVMDASSGHDRGYLIGLYTGTYRLGNLVGMLGGGLMADAAGLRPTPFSYWARPWPPWPCPWPCSCSGVPRPPTGRPKKRNLPGKRASSPLFPANLSGCCSPASSSRSSSKASSCPP